MSVQVLQGDCREVLKTLPDESIHCCVTSPPYFGLRDYKGGAAEIGLESSPEEYVGNMVAVFREIWRVLRKDGTIWLNLGDSYGTGTTAIRQPSRTSTKISPMQHEAQGSRHGGMAKQLLGIPWMVAFALQEDGWYLRSDIVWSKPSCMPESVRDRPTRSHEYIFLLAKSERYWYDADAIREEASPVSMARIAQPNFANQAGGSKDYATSGINPNRSARKALENFAKNPGRNKRSVWEVNTQPYPDAHYAVFPEKLIEPCILAGCPVDGTVLDPFAGSGTTLSVAAKHNRNAIGIELNPDYIALIEKRLGRTEVRLPFEQEVAS